MAEVVTITVTASPEDFTPEWVEKHGHASAGFANAVHAVQKKNELWGWCKVKVTVKLVDGRTGADYLGQCSYESETDFILNSGYYPDMVRAAITDASRLTVASRS